MEKEGYFMELRGRRVLICDCEETMPLDAGRLAKACQAVGATGEVELNSQLCRAQLGNFQRAILGRDPVLVACTQEAPLFTEIATEDNPAAEVGFVNIRERAGWSAEAKDATPKIAALLAEAAMDIEPGPAMTLVSHGVCLVYGTDERAFEAGRQLSSRLDVTVLLNRPGEIVPPRIMDVPIFQGTITQAKGHLGAFGITLNGYAPTTPSGRAALAFEAPRDNAFSECDLILDMSGRAPLFTAHEKRDGYLHVDPDDPVALQKAIYELADMVGEYEKPRYIRFDGDLCAHSRARKTGCTRCLDLCPASAIQPAGDVVAIDPHLCAGCGVCASVCPTGAATYQLPGGDSVFERLRTLLDAYRKAGGEAPVLLVHDTRHGEDLVALMARSGRGLPARVLPFALNEATQVGIDFLAMALAYGAAGICFLIDPRKRDDLAGLASQIGLAETAMEGLGHGGGRIQVLDHANPEEIEAALHALKRLAAPKAGNFLPMGGKRTRTMLAFRHLHDHAPRKPEVLPLPAGAPFGAVEIDTAGCTLCLACVGACPTGALADDPDRPWLGFKEEACIQCGLCRVTCPESAVTLDPRFNFTAAARDTVTVNQQQPFHCIRCGKPFGVEATIERIAEKLGGKHSMFAAQDQIERIMMCEDCRVSSQFEIADNPLQGAARPIPRTTDDDLREREIMREREKLRAEAASPGGKPNGGPRKS